MGTKRPSDEPVLVHMTVVVDAGAATVVVEGEIDLSTADQLRQCLEGFVHRGRHQLRVDMAKVTFIDAAGLHVLVGVNNSLRPWGQLIVRNPSGIVRRVLTLSELDRILLVEPAIEPGAQPA